MNDLIMELKSENEFKFDNLYKANFGKISNLVRKNSGTEADAQDLFQDIMLVIVEKLQQDHFHLTASLDTYVFAIGKNLWFKKLRDRNSHLSLDECQALDFQVQLTDVIIEEKTYLGKLREYMLKISEHCNRLINDMFFEKKDIEHIQKKYNYTTKHNAQNQKHKCVEQIRKVKSADKKK